MIQYFKQNGFFCHISLFTARFATSRYQEPTTSNISNVFMHLTNYSVNKQSPAYIMDEEVGSKRYAAVSLVTAFSNLLNMSSVLLIFMCDQLTDWLTDSLTNFIERSPSREANSCSAIQEVLQILWD